MLVRTHSPELHPESASPWFPNSVLSADCLKLQLVSLVEQAMERVPERVSMMLVRSRPPPLPQKVVPGMQTHLRGEYYGLARDPRPQDDERTHWRFWQSQSIEVLLRVWMQVSALQ